MIYGNAPYGGGAYSRPAVIGTRTIPITIAYQPGMAVMVTGAWTASIPPNTAVVAEAASASAGEWVTLKNGEFVTVNVNRLDAGDENISVRLTLSTTDPVNVVPRVGGMITTIRQTVTYAALAVMALQDAGLKPEEYWVDPELENFPLPYAWLEKQTHREALRTIAEAGLAQVYTDRNGVIRVEGATYLSREQEQIALYLTKCDYYDKNNPTNSGAVANYVEVFANPLRPAQAAEEVYRATEEIPAGVRTYTALYNDKPVIEAVASLEAAPVGATITSAKYYAWGADIQVSSPEAGEIELVVTGKPLRSTGRQKMVASDSKSIRENGERRYIFPDNPLIQTPETAQRIADLIVAICGNPRRDLSLNWRGNPALLLGHRITVPDYDGATRDFHVVRNEFTWDGALQATLDGRAT
jgi:hypothetical protein